MIGYESFGLDAWGGDRGIVVFWPVGTTGNCAKLQVWLGKSGVGAKKAVSKGGLGAILRLCQAKPQIVNPAANPTRFGGYVKERSGGPTSGRHNLNLLG